MSLVETLMENYSYYVQHFNRLEYAELFEKLKSRLDPFFESTDTVNIPALIDELLAFTEGRIRFPWRRSFVLFELQQYFLLYLVPAALDSAYPAAAEFGGLLRQCWNERYPKHSFAAATYEDIASGFENNIFGFKIGR